MIFRQLFDSVSGTYSYLLASRAGGEALILDPVLEKADRYCQLLRELDLRLVKAVDTHLHADHIGDLAGMLLYGWGVRVGADGPLAPIRVYGPPRRVIEVWTCVDRLSIHYDIIRP